jgi:iron complex transport system substrate-binding protein
MQKRFHTVMVALMLALLSVSGAGAQAATCAEGERAIAHALGEACVSETAQRVVALEWTYAENLLALGVQPVGVADIAGYENWLNIPLTLDPSVADVGTRQEPNFEAITALEPDLIIAVSFRAGQNYETLSAIAPTLVFDPYPTDGTTHYDEMLATFNTMAVALGREAEAETVLAGLEADLAAARASLAAAGRLGESFVLAQIFPSNEIPTFRLFTDNALATEILVQAGLVNAWGDAPQQFGFSTVEFEGLVGIEADNFLYVAQDDYQPVLTGSPLWNGLPFVANERAYWLGGDAWLFGGPLSMQVVLTTILEAMDVAAVDTAEVTTCADGFRLFEHPLLATEPLCVPVAPQRVVALDPAAVDVLISAGTPPVGMVGYLENILPNTFPYLAETTAQIVSVGFPPNPEAILALEPDLIVGSSYDLDLYEQLSAIAPTALYLTDASGEWKEGMYFVGEVLNQQAVVEQLFADYEARVASIAEAIGTPQDIVVSVVRVLPDRVMLNLSNSFPSTVVADVGFARPESQAFDPEAAIERYGSDVGVDISLEELPMADGDVIFVWGAQPTSDQDAATNENWQALVSNPLWGTLGAVQREQVYRVGSTWVGWGFHAAHGILDDLTTFMVPDGADVLPNPFIAADAE